MRAFIPIPASLAIHLVECSKCKAPIGEPCTHVRRKKRKELFHPHFERMIACQKGDAMGARWVGLVEALIATQQGRPEVAEGLATVAIWAKEEDVEAGLMRVKGESGWTGP